MTKIILIIDDQPAPYLDEVLEGQGYEVHIFTDYSSNRREIIRHIDSGSVEYILVDYSLGPDEASGADIIEWLLDRGYDGTIIGISSAENDNKRMVASGAAFFINKEELVDKISLHI